MGKTKLKPEITNMWHGRALDGGFAMARLGVSRFGFLACSLHRFVGGFWTDENRKILAASPVPIPKNFSQAQ